ncbi:MAG: tape measure protein [Eubacterium sp.]|nr:tape measure protein [Eubacterium sp.]
MAMTVSASIQLNDLMSGPIMHIMSAIDTMCNHLELVDSAIDKGFDTSGIFEVRQQIDLANAELVEMQNKIESVDNATKKVENSTDNWLGGISKIGAGYLSLKGVMEGIKFAVGYSDNLTQNTNRLSLMNDGTQSTDSLQQDIYESAMRARASISDTMSAVASLGQRAGDSFQSNQEIIQFVENLNKQFAIAGATQQEQASATLQLTQALGSGVLRGEELNAVFESAPNVIQTIADYLEVPIGQIKAMINLNLTRVNLKI